MKSSSKQWLTSRETDDLAYQVALLTCALVSLAMVVAILFACKHGFDFTDEGFYLASLKNPWLYSASTTQFGFVYSPLYDAVGGSIYAVRLANVTITLALAFVLFVLLLRSQTDPNNYPIRHRFVDLVLAFGLATSSFALFSTWLVTPSYNSLALQAMLMVGIAILLLRDRISWVRMGGWALIGIGGALAFLAKPTSAALLAPLTLLVLAISRQIRAVRLVVSLASCGGVLLAFAYWIDGGVREFFRRVQNGVEHVHLLEGGHSVDGMFRLDLFSPLGSEWMLAVCAVVATLAMILAGVAASPRVRVLSQVGSVSISALALMLIAGFADPWAPRPSHAGVGVLAPAAAAIVAAFFLAQRSQQVTRSMNWPFLIYVLAAPWVFAFGTNRPYWMNEIYAGAFVVAAGTTVLIARLDVQRLRLGVLPLVCVVQLFATNVVWLGMQHPYRQAAPLTEQTHPVVIGSDESLVWVTEGSANYLEWLGIESRIAGFRPGVPVLDLTGQSPGTLFALGARQVGAPWWVGGYRGSFAYADAVIQGTQCEELARAWLLVERGGRRSFQESLVEEFGADLAADYEIVVVVDTPKGDPRYADRRPQQLHRPTRSIVEAEQACLLLRRDTALVL